MFLTPSYSLASYRTAASNIIKIKLFFFTKAKSKLSLKTLPNSCQKISFLSQHWKLLLPFQFRHRLCSLSYPQSVGRGRPSRCRRSSTALRLRGPTPPSPTAAPPPPAASRPPPCWAPSTSICTPRRLTLTHTCTRWAAWRPSPSGHMTA